VLPYYVSVVKLQQDVPDLMNDTWLLRLEDMPTNPVFGAAATKTIRCQPGVASVNPDYELRRIRDLAAEHGVPARDFAEWYGGWREVGVRLRQRRDPWLARGLRVAIVLPQP